MQLELGRGSKKSGAEEAAQCCHMERMEWKTTMEGLGEAETRKRAKMSGTEDLDIG